MTTNSQRLAMWKAEQKNAVTDLRAILNAIDAKQRQLSEAYERVAKADEVVDNWSEESWPE